MLHKHALPLPGKRHEIRRTDTRPNSAARGYDADHRRLKSIVAAESESICYICRKPIVGEAHLDHIEAFHGRDDPLRLERSNVALAHPACHRRKTNERDGGYGNPVKKYGDDRHSG